MVRSKGSAKQSGAAATAAASGTQVAKRATAKQSKKIANDGPTQSTTTTRKASATGNATAKSRRGTKRNQPAVDDESTPEITTAETENPAGSPIRTAAAAPSKSKLGITMPQKDLLRARKELAASKSGREHQRPTGGEKEQASKKITEAANSTSGGTLFGSASKRRRLAGGVAATAVAEGGSEIDKEGIEGAEVSEEASVDLTSEEQVPHARSTANAGWRKGPSGGSRAIAPTYGNSSGGEDSSSTEQAALQPSKEHAGLRLAPEVTQVDDSSVESAKERATNPADEDETAAANHMEETVGRQTDSRSILTVEFGVHGHKDKAQSLAQWMKEWHATNVAFVVYTRASTPGCTKQCAAVNKLKLPGGVQAVGVSLDGYQKQNVFASKLNLSFPLVTTGGKKLLQAINCLGVDGKIIRSMVVVNDKGDFVYERHKVSPEPSVTALAEFLMSLQTPERLEDSAATSDESPSCLSAEGSPGGMAHDTAALADDERSVEGDENAAAANVHERTQAGVQEEDKAEMEEHEIEARPAKSAASPKRRNKQPAVKKQQTAVRGTAAASSSKQGRGGKQSASASPGPKRGAAKEVQKTSKKIAGTAPSENASKAKRKGGRKKQ